MRIPKCEGGFVILPDELRTRETLINFLKTDAALPGGEDTYIQFNEGGAFGGSKNLIFDNSVGTLTAYHIRASNRIDTVRLSASSDLQVVGATILGSHLKVSASVTLGGGAGDYLSSSSGAQFKMSVSSSSDLAVTGAMHAANFYGTGVVSASGDLYGSNLYISAVGIGTATPITALDIHHNPTGLSNDTGGGDVVTFGTEDGTDTLAAGKLMYLHSGSGVWKYTDADVAESGSSQLLGIALGAAVSDGILIRGFFDATTYLSGTFRSGMPVYASVGAPYIQSHSPSGSADFVRIVGYSTSTANVIYFNPSSTYIEVS